MFPEFGCGDMTMGNNSEKRPLKISGGKDGNNKGFSHTWAFLPSQSKWVFFWYYETAMRELNHLSVLARVRLYVTDQDQQLMYGFIATII
jgi:hypothetical protein